MADEVLVERFEHHRRQPGQEPRHRRGAQDLEQDGVEGGTDDGTADGGDAAQIDHDEDLGRLDDVEDPRADELQQVGEQGPGDAGAEGRQHEGQYLDPLGIDAHQVAGDLVLADGQYPAPEGGIDEVAQQPHQDHRPAKDQRQSRQPRDAGDAARAADHIDVLEGGLDDHQEGQGDDGQIIAAHLEGGDRDQKPQQGGDEPPRQHRQMEQPRVGGDREHVQGQQHGGVGTDRHEAGMGQGEFPHVAVHQVEAGGQDDVDAHQDHHQLDVVVDQPELRNGKGQCQPDGQQERQQPALLHQPLPVNPQGGPHTFCTRGWPRMPWGRMTISASSRLNTTRSR